MANTAVMTVRLEAELLARLKERARAHGRSTSAEVVHLLRDHVVTKQGPRATRPSMGMFRQFDAPDLEDFATASAALQSSFDDSLQRPTAKKRGRRT